MINLTTTATTVTLALSLFFGSMFAGGMPGEAFSASRLIPAASLLTPETGQTAPPSPAAPAPGGPRRKIALAAGECVGLNLAVWAFFHYVENAHYTYISWDTMRDNVRDSFEWDPNLFCVNFFHHPYHGGMSFNAARANGLDYWGSAFSAFGGSLMWELFLELNRPSINDLVLTTTGGSVFGEVAYRLASRVRRKGARGLERVLRGTTAALLNPVGALNRLLDGRSGDTGKTPAGAPAVEVPVSGEVLLGGALVGRRPWLRGAKAATLIAFTLDYGDPEARPTGRVRPFDTFTLTGQLRLEDGKPNLTLSASGALTGWVFAPGGRSSHFFGIYQDYDFINIETFRFGGSSFSGGLRSRFKLGPKVQLSTSVRLGWLALSGSDDPDVKDGNRDYNYGMGWTTALRADLSSAGRDYLSASWRHFGIYTLKGLPGNDSWDILQGRAALPIWRNWGAGVRADYFYHHLHFKDYPQSTRRLYEVRAFLTYQF
jgi:hypothetical protein